MPRCILLIYSCLLQTKSDSDWTLPSVSGMFTFWNYRYCSWSFYSEHFRKLWRRKIAHGLDELRKQIFFRNSRHFCRSNHLMTSPCQWAGVAYKAEARELYGTKWCSQSSHFHNFLFILRVFAFIIIITLSPWCLPVCPYPCPRRCDFIL